MNTSISQNLFKRQNSQQGMVLVVSLLILLVMTLIGVTAMQNTGQDERMSSNSRQRNLAFHAAEAALRAGEARLPIAEGDVSTGGGFNGTSIRDTTQLVRVGNCDFTVFWANGYCWNGTYNKNCATSPPSYPTSTSCTVASEEATDLTSNTLSVKPRYVIERLAGSSTKAKRNSLQAGANLKATGNSSGGQRLYRITARGVGGISDATVILQSLYLK